MIYLKLLVSQLIPLVLGLGLVSLFLKREIVSSKIERLGLAYGLGTMLITLISSWLIFLNIPLSLTSILLPVGLFGLAIYFVIVKNKYPFFMGEGGKKWSWQARALLLALGIKLTYIFYEALVKPVIGWDAWGNWAIKAKIFFLTDLPAISYFKDYPIGIVDYPLHLPLLEAWTFRCLGTWNDHLVKIIFPLYLCAILAIVFASLRRTQNKEHSLLFTLILASLPFLTFHATIEYVDFMVGYYFTAAILMLYNWGREKKTGFLWLAIVFAGCLPLVKKEGLFFLLLTVLLLGLLYWKQIGWKRAVMIFIVPILTTGPWFIFKLLSNVHVNTAQNIYIPSLETFFDRLQNIAAIFPAKMFFAGNWNLLWSLLLIALAMNGKKILAQQNLPIFLGLGLSFLMLISIYLFTDSYIYLLDGTTLNRNMLIIIPLTVFALGLLAAPLLGGQHHERSNRSSRKP